MIVVDTSAWIELLRGTGSRIDRLLFGLVEADEELVVTEVVVMELLSGARTAREARALRLHLEAYPVLGLDGLADYEAAAELYRACARSGSTIRRMTGCLVAVPAIAAGAPVLHADRDFDVLARHTRLEVVAVDE